MDNAGKVLMKRLLWGSAAALLGVTAQGGGGGGGGAELGRRHHDDRVRDRRRRDRVERHDHERPRKLQRRHVEQQWGLPAGRRPPRGTCTGTTSSGTAMGVVAGMVPGPGTIVAGCEIFPPDNAWNVNVSASSIATTTKYTGIPQGTHLHPDLGGWTPPNGPYGIPYNVVPSGQAEVSITFNQFANESDPGPGGWTTNPNGGDTGATKYPIPNNPKIEGDPAAGQIAGDDHLLVLQQGASACGCTLWETWQTTGGTQAPWTAANGAKWDLGSNALRQPGWTSADAAGLSVFAGLLRIAEVKAGVVDSTYRRAGDVQREHPGRVRVPGDAPPGGSGALLGLARIPRWACTSASRPASTPRSSAAPGRSWRRA